MFSGLTSPDGETLKPVFVDSLTRVQTMPVLQSNVPSAPVTMEGYVLCSRLLEF